MTAELWNFAQAVIVALITGTFTVIGISIKDNKKEVARQAETEKKEAVKQAQDDAHFKAIETSILTLQQIQTERLSAMQKETLASIGRLEEAQRKYNNLQERTIKAEQSLKSLHKRLDNFEGKEER